MPYCMQIFMAAFGGLFDRFSGVQNGAHSQRLGGDEANPVRLCGQTCRYAVHIVALVQIAGIPARTQPFLHIKKLS